MMEFNRCTRRFHTCEALNNVRSMSTEGKQVMLEKLEAALAQSVLMGRKYDDELLKKVRRELSRNDSVNASN